MLEHLAEQQLAAVKGQVVESVLRAVVEHGLAVFEAEESDQLVLALVHEAREAEVLCDVVEQHPAGFVQPLGDNQIP